MEDNMALTDEKKNLQSMTDDVVDIQLSTPVKRTKFRVNGDNDAIIELNLSDVGIMGRLKNGLEKLQSEVSAMADIPDDDDNLADKLKQIDQKMREAVDYIFDYPVSNACAKYGTMYDPKDGVLRYEAIIDGLTTLYADNLNSEYKKMKARMGKHIDKYVAPKKRK